MSDKTYKGKIGRLPAKIREELCQRMEDGQPGSVILPWLNSLSEVHEIMARQFGGVKISNSNLTEWRKGGYQVWLSYRKQIGSAGEMADKLFALAEAAFGRLGKGVVAQLAGSMMAYLETPDEEVEIEVDGKTKKVRRPSPDKLELQRKMTKTIVAAEQKQSEIDMRGLQLEQAGDRLKLDKLKFETQFCNGVLKGAEDKEAQRIAGMNITNDEKISLLRKHFFKDVDEMPDLKLPE